MPPDTSFLADGFKPTVAAANPQDVMAFQQRQQLGAQQLQSGALELKQKQIDMNDQENLRQNYMKAAGDMDKFQQLNQQTGVSPKAIMGVQKSVLEMKTAAEKLSADKLDNQAKKNDQLSALLAPVNAEQDPAKQAALWDQQTKIGVQNNILTAAEAAQHPYPGSPQAVSGYVAHLATDKWVTAQAAAARAAAAERTANTGVTRENAELPGQVAAADLAQRKNGAAILGGAINQDDYTAKRKALPPAVAVQFPEQFDATPAATAKINRIGMNPDERAADDQKTANLQREIKVDAETNRHHLSEESNAKLNSGIAAGHLALSREVNGMKYGPGTQEYWVQQLQENPDSIKEMPPELRSVVGQKFKTATGLPLPTPLEGSSKSQETAARTTLGNIDWIRNAIGDPEISSQLGPLLGRIGDTEQKIGAAHASSPEMERKMQELRTRVRQFVIVDSRALSGGGRATKQVLDQLQDSSASPKMEPAMFNGALDGTAGSAQNVMSSLDAQRFGGKSRTPQQRGDKAPAAPAAKVVPTPASQAEFNALPRGAAFKKPGDSTTYYKQ